MSRGISTFVKGMAVGLLAGASICTSCKMMMNNNKCAKKKISNSIKTVSDFMENISYMLK